MPSPNLTGMVKSAMRPGKAVVPCKEYKEQALYGMSGRDVRFTGQEDGKESEEVLRKAINALEGNSAEKIFTEKEKEEIAKMNPEYVKDLVKDPEKL